MPTHWLSKEDQESTRIKEAPNKLKSRDPPKMQLGHGSRERMRNNSRWRKLANA